MDCYGNLLTRLYLVELDADRKNHKFTKCFASTMVLQNYNKMKIGKSSETYQLKTRKRKYQQLIPIPKATWNVRP